MQELKFTVAVYQGNGGDSLNRAMQELKYDDLNGRFHLPFRLNRTMQELLGWRSRRRKERLKRSQSHHAGIISLHQEAGQNGFLHPE